MSLSPTALGARLAALHAASFVGLGFHLPFFPVWLASKGLTATAIGFVVAAAIVVRIVATAPLLALADRPGGARRLLIASHLGQIVGFPLLMLLDDPLAIGATAAAIAVAQAAVIPGNDLVTTTAVRTHQGLHYGRIRGFGSIAFLVATIGAGYLVDAFGARVIVWALALAPLGALLATCLVVPAAASARREDGRAPPLPAALWLVMAAAALTQGTHGALYAFGSIHWGAIGFSDTAIGYLWAIGVVAEILVFYLFGRGVGRGSAGFGLLLAGAAGAALRFAVLALDPGLPATIALQALHGLSFGATHLGAMAALAAMAPDAARGRAQGLMGSLMALSTAAATVASGFIYRAAGPAVFAAMAPLGVAAFLLVLAAMRRAQPQRAGEGG
jgi:MFS transporter, PPP family, 3-phenylpropionic acid transporter